MSADERELRRAVAVLDQYRAQLEGLGQQQEFVRISLEEHLRARETLTRFHQAGKGAEVLVPVGANAYVVAEVRDPDNALVGIGSDLVVQDEIPKHLERLDARIASITEAANAIGERLAEVQRRAEAQTAFVQNEYDRLQAGGAQGESE